MVEKFTEIQRDAFTEVGDFIMGALASVISGIAGNEASIDSPVLDTVLLDEAKAAHDEPVVVIDVKYNAGFKGNSSMIFKADDMAVLYNLASGLDPSEPGADLENIADNELGEVVNQMVNQLVNASSEIFDRLIVISPPGVRLVLPAEAAGMVPWGSGNDPVLKVDYRFAIEGVFESSLTQIIPMPLARSMVNILLDIDEDEEVFDSGPGSSAVPLDDYVPPPPTPPDFESAPEPVDDVSPGGREELTVPDEEANLAGPPAVDDYVPEDLSELRAPVESSAPDDFPEDLELPAAEEMPIEKQEVLPDLADIKEQGYDLESEAVKEPAKDEEFDISSVSSDDLTFSGGPDAPQESDPLQDLFSQDEISKLISGTDDSGQEADMPDFEGADDIAALFAGDNTGKKEPEKFDSAAFEVAEPFSGSSDGADGGEEDKPLSYEQSLEKLELLKDIPIKLTVVMGENHLPLKDLVNAGKGSVISLRRYAREPVDIMVNDQLVARGEVVVVDSRIGVRIVSIETRLPQITHKQAAK